MLLTNMFFRSRLVHFARAISNKHPENFLSRGASLNVIPKPRTFVRSHLGRPSKAEVNSSRYKYLYLITAGWFFTIAEAYRRSKINAATAADTSNDSRAWNFIADVVEKAAPAVVYIEILGKHPFTGKTMAIANGSGFIVRADGLILTNAHVVGNCKSVTVRLSDGTRKIGFVQAVDAVSDLATLKIPGENLPVLSLGNSHLLRPGEFVVAMGSPLQLSNTVTAGIVSSANRKSEDLGLHNKGLTYIQTDANINFGNSGGPLVNLEGQAIGINTMTVTNGISFAIPSDFAREFLAKAAKVENSQKRDRRGWIITKDNTPDKKYIGITMLTITPDLALSLKIYHSDLLNVDHGVLVYRVVPGSPADVGGIKPGDIILKMNGKRIEGTGDIYRALESDETTLTVDVIRGHETLTFIIASEFL